MALEITHSHTCLALGYYNEPAPDCWLLMPARHPSRASTTLSTLIALASPRDAAAALLEPFAVHLAQSSRPGKKQTSLTLDQPLRASVSLEALLFFDVLCAAYAHSLANFPIDLETGLDPLAVATEPAALGGGKKRERVEATHETMLGTVPGVELTLLSTDRPCLPLLQLSLGGDAGPINLITEKLTASAPLTAEVCVPLSARFYNCGLLCWEPLVEPLQVDVRTQQSVAASALSSVTLSLRGSLELNVSDTMLTATQTNLRALFEAKAARRTEWSPALDADAARLLLLRAGATEEEEPYGASYWVVNETGEEIRYWATEDAEEESSSAAPQATNKAARRVHELPAGGRARLAIWDAEAAAVLAKSGWCEDTPRRLTVRLPGAKPLPGLVVNR